MRRGIIPLLAVLAAGCGTQAPPPAISSGQVELTPMTVAELDRDIAGYKGKVVYIDAWFLG